VIAKNQKRTTAELVDDVNVVTRGIRNGVRDALIRHKKLGESIAVWQDGKVVIVPPEEIVIPPLDEPGQPERK
jgi:hypothetical protein